MCVNKDVFYKMLWEQVESMDCIYTTVKSVVYRIGYFVIMHAIKLYIIILLVGFNIGKIYNNFVFLY